ncbi:MAG: aldo/keto reductase [Acidimicrobiales bacterium]|jgi:aryl-alcohol dehydrogenase-like predicted oxidoreductase
MAKRRIGSLEVSVVGLGCNNFGGRVDSDRTAEVVSTAIDAGITLFDTADIYGGTHSEELLGRALGRHRDQVVVATKFGMAVDAEHKGAKPDYVRRALENSLRRLGTDHVDLYQLHQPDPETPIADTLAALDELVRAGKIREIGCSNFSAAQIREAQAAVREGATRFVSVQNEYSLLKRDPELEVLPECQRFALAFIPYYPLSSGVLTGKYRRGEPPPAGTRLAGTPTGRTDSLLSDETLSVVEALEAFAVRNGHSVLELAVAWLAARPTVASVIAGATTPAQVRANAMASNWVLTDAELAEVDKIAPVA